MTMSIHSFLLSTGIGLAAAGFLRFLLAVLRRDFSPDPVTWAYYAIGNWTLCASAVIDHSPLAASLDAVLAAFYTYRWWKDRDQDGKRRKALREIGAKSRARIAALVENMTPSPVPSPSGGSA